MVPKPIRSSSRRRDLGKLYFKINNINQYWQSNRVFQPYSRLPRPKRSLMTLQRVLIAIIDDRGRNRSGNTPTTPAFNNRLMALRACCRNRSGNAPTTPARAPVRPGIAVRRIRHKTITLLERAAKRRLYSIQNREGSRHAKICS